MAAQPQPLSLDDFHQQYDGAKPAYEYWYGTAIQKPMPTALHGAVQMLIMLLLEKAGWNALSEVRLKVRRDAEPVPDVIAVHGKLKGRYPTAAPELCIEILSPDDRLPEAFEKAGRYILWGTRCVWIIDPEKRTAWSLLPENAGKPLWIDPDGALQIGDTIIPLTTLFDEVDKKLDTTEENSISGRG